MNKDSPAWKVDLTLTFPAWQWYAVLFFLCHGLNSVDSPLSSKTATIDVILDLENSFLSLSLFSPADISRINEDFL